MIYDMLIEVFLLLLSKVSLLSLVCKPVRCRKRAYRAFVVYLNVIMDIVQAFLSILSSTADTEHSELY